jgi:hypothetical protein
MALPHLVWPSPSLQSPSHIKVECSFDVKMTPGDESSTVFLSNDDDDSTYYANSTATAEQLELEGLKEEDDSHTSQHLDNRSCVFGTIEYGDGGIYTGYMSDNLPHGYGNLVYPDDISYLGYWSNGLEHGCGTMRWSNGEWFHGKFEHSHPIGHGYRHGGARCKLVGPNLHEIAD